MPEGPANAVATKPPVPKQIYVLDAIGSVDGRYRRQTEPLAEMFSERGLMIRRLMVEGEYLIFLTECGLGKRKLTDVEKAAIRVLYTLSPEDAQIIKELELRGYGDIKATNHDVKAIEYYMRMKLKGTTLEDMFSWIHFGLTSEDVNNLAYALMLKSGTRVLLHELDEIRGTLAKVAKLHRALPMLARTHGQDAVPTTAGKEFAVFYRRLSDQVEQLRNFRIKGKLNGATGNYNAHVAVYPEHEWDAFTCGFIATLDTTTGTDDVRIIPNLITTQIEPHDTYAELFDTMRRTNTILIGLCQDIWRYVSDHWIIQIPVEGEVGSSTMSQKVNPIDFENAEGNFGLANALFTYFSTKLPISRLQRDLSDSTVERAFGVAFSFALVGYLNTLKGFGKIAVNEAAVLQAVDRNPAVLAEMIQTVFRSEGDQDAYEKLSAATRGKEVTLEDLRKVIEASSVPDATKELLYSGLDPKKYIGIAPRLVDQALRS